MAKIIKTDTVQGVSSVYSLQKVALIGAGLGIIYWVLTAFIVHFVSSTGTSGDIATILVAALGIAIMVKLNMIQPLIVATASGFALWGLSLWTSGLGWGEIIIWNILLYGLAYILFSWIARYARLASALPAMIIIILILRIAISV